MPTSTDITKLVINQLTEAQYDAAVQAGTIGATDICFLTDAEAGQIIQVSTMPTATSTEEGNIYQFIGTTGTYTNGYFYKCINNSGTYSWQQINVQPQGSSSLSTLSDVSLSSPASGQYLKYDGSNWVNDTVSYLPTTGGTLTGNITFSDLGEGIKFAGSSTYTQSIYATGSTSLKFISSYSSDQAIEMDLGRAQIAPVYSNNGYLGTTTYYWGEGAIAKLHATYLQGNVSAVDNSSNYISIPQVGGKLCLYTTNMPTASSTYEGQVYQYIGTTDSIYTNGYFYQCVSDGGNPATYSWVQLNVQQSDLPSQSGHSGEFLTTDGTDASWGPALVNNTTSTNSLSIEGSITSSSSDASDLAIKGSIGSNAQYSIAIGTGSSCGSHYSVALGAGSYADYYATAIGRYASAGDTNAVALGNGAKASGQNSIQLGSGYRTNAYNSDANTFKVANANGNFEIMSADGTIPADRLKNAINKYSTMPTASVNNLGWIVQFIGTTDSTYTHGYLYECVSDGQNPATYSWTAVQVQASSGSSLPSQTGNAGKFLTTDGTDASWSDKPLVNKDTSSGGTGIGIGGSTADLTDSVRIGVGATAPSGSCTVIGKDASAKFLGTAVGNSSSAAAWGVAIGNSAVNSDYTSSVAIGNSTLSSGDRAIAIGGFAQATADNSVMINASGTTATNNVAGTLNFANYNGGHLCNYQIVSADGTIPEARLADTTNAAQGQVLTLDSNLNAVWQASSGGGLPSQTGNTGKFLTTDGTDASWSAVVTFRVWGGNE